MPDKPAEGGGLQVVATRMPVSGTGQQRPIFQPPKIPQQQPVKDASAVKEAVNRAAPSAKVTADTSNKENADTGSAALDAPVKAVQKATQALRARRVLQTALKGRAILPSSEAVSASQSGESPRSAPPSPDATSTSVAAVEATSERQQSPTPNAPVAAASRTAEAAHRTGKGVSSAVQVPGSFQELQREVAALTIQAKWRDHKQNSTPRSSLGKAETSPHLQSAPQDTQHAAASNSEAPGDELPTSAPPKEHTLPLQQPEAASSTEARAATAIPRAETTGNAATSSSSTGHVKVAHRRKRTTTPRKPQAGEAGQLSARTKGQASKLSATSIDGKQASQPSQPQPQAPEAGASQDHSPQPEAHSQAGEKPQDPKEGALNGQQAGVDQVQAGASPKAASATDTPKPGTAATKPPIKGKTPRSGPGSSSARTAGSPVSTPAHSHRSRTDSRILSPAETQRIASALTAEEAMLKLLLSANDPDQLLARKPSASNDAGDTPAKPVQDGKSSSSRIMSAVAEEDSGSLLQAESSLALITLVHNDSPVVRQHASHSTTPATAQQQVSTKAAPASHSSPSQAAQSKAPASESSAAPTREPLPYRMTPSPPVGACITIGTPTKQLAGAAPTPKRPNLPTPGSSSTQGQQTAQRPQLSSSYADKPDDVKPAAVVDQAAVTRRKVPQPAASVTEGTGSAKQGASGVGRGTLLRSDSAMGQGAGTASASKPAENSVPSKSMSADIWKMLQDAESAQEAEPEPTPPIVPPLRLPASPVEQAAPAQPSGDRALSGQRSLPGPGGSVVEGVRAKMAHLQEALEGAQGEVETLQRRLHMAARQHKADLSDAQLQIQVALQEQRHESNAAAARQLKLIDRLRVDKEGLAAKGAELAHDLKEVEAKHTQQVTLLKDGWAKELKRQRELWAAGEKQRRESWMAQKTRAVKDQTIKGLEPEMQRLISQHQSELQGVKQQCHDSCQQRLHELMMQRDAREIALREAWARERDAALDREQAAASERLRDTANRYEDQLQEQRRRLMAEVSQHSIESGGLSKAERERLEDELHTARQEALEAKKAREEAVHGYVAKQREYDNIAKEMKAAHDKVAADLKEQVRLEVAALEQSLLAARKDNAALQMSLNTETAAKLAGEKALRAAQDGLAMTRQQVQAAGKEADQRCRQLQQQLTDKDAELSAVQQEAGKQRQEVTMLQSQLRQHKEAKAEADVQWRAQLAEKDSRHSNAAARLQHTLSQKDMQAAQAQTEHQAEMQALAQRTKEVLQKRDSLHAEQARKLHIMQERLQEAEAAMQQQAAAMAALC